MDSFFCVNPNIFPIFPFSPANIDMNYGIRFLLLFLPPQKVQKISAIWQGLDNEGPRPDQE